jgi:phage baseplate assembly protein W
VVRRGFVSGAGNRLLFQDELPPPLSPGRRSSPRSRCRPATSRWASRSTRPGVSLKITCDPKPPASKSATGTVEITVGNAGSISIKAGTGGSITIDGGSKLELKAQQSIKISSDMLVEIFGQADQVELRGCPDDRLHRHRVGVSHRGGGDRRIALVRGDTELVQAMRLILSTYPGERPMRPDFGCRLRDYVFRAATLDTIAELTAEVRRALLRWEPRVRRQRTWWSRRAGRSVRAAHRDRVPAEGHQRPPQPGLPVLHDPRRPRERLLMALPTPDLDDRRFQDLVNDAKRMVMRRCPEWTDHNVSDPGVTLIETFAFMTDQLLFRLNRVPDRLYLKFLDLIGLQLGTTGAGGSAADVLAVRAGDRTADHHRRDASGHAAH